MILAQTVETAKAVMEGVDKASMAGDRWLFIATLVLLLGFVGIVIKWLVSSIEAKDKAHATTLETRDKIHATEREVKDAELKAERAESRAQRKEDQAIYIAEFKTISTELHALSVAQEKNTEVLIAHDREMRDSHKLQLRAAVHEELIRQGAIKHTDIGS